MAWEENKARQRIQKFIDSAPETGIIVETFSSYASKRKILLEERSHKASSSVYSIVDIPRNQAITTNGVHIYANLIDFKTILNEAGRETESMHKRALEFLHAHYIACDNLITEYEIQRVDFHGSRLHAVVLTPEGEENELARINKAISFASAFRELVFKLGHTYSEFKTNVRIGIDSGFAVAIDGGKKDEPEPLFIGRPANHAAKLADGNDAGIYVSEYISLIRNRRKDVYTLPLEIIEESAVLKEAIDYGSKVQRAELLLETALNYTLNSISDLKKSEISGNVSFNFHYKIPPLKSIVFADHPPSKAIRMPLASIFADIDGFTDYIDNAIRNNSIPTAVSNLHVLRAEMSAVLRDDFGGRKVRFIGDCIHGLIAEGSEKETDDRETIKAAILSASGIRSSFELCKNYLNGIGQLGIAIGIEYGITPICRIGIRGDASVRIATSRASFISEEEQRRCSGNQTAIGESAHQAASARIKQLFLLPDRKASNLDYEQAIIFLDDGALQNSSANYAPIKSHQHSHQTIKAHNN